MKREALALFVSTVLLSGCERLNQQYRVPLSNNNWVTENPTPFDPLNCAQLPKPLVRPVVGTFRAESVAQLSDLQFVALTDVEAARLIGVKLERHDILASKLISSFLAEQRETKYRAEVENRDSWSLADQDEFVDLIARSSTRQFDSYKPYLVRAVGNTREPALIGAVCEDDLLMESVLMGTWSVAHRLPAVVFISKSPIRVTTNVSRTM